MPLLAMSSSQGESSQLFPPKLLPKNVRDVVKVCILVGQFLRPLPDPSPPADLIVEQGSAKGGRPRKGTVRPAKKAAGRFGGQSGRDAEHQIQLLQQDWSLRCIPKACFVRLAKETLSSVLPKDLGFEPKLTSSALEVLHDATEAGPGAHTRMRF